MRSKPSLPAVNVTIMFTGKMPTSVSVRRVDATHANALPTYEASKFPRSNIQKRQKVLGCRKCLSPLRHISCLIGTLMIPLSAVGAPQYPDMQAIAALKHASALVVETLEPIPVVDASVGGDTGWALSLMMPMYSVASLSF